MATIVDVAKKAGVSIKTVSRVMNNEANVREATRQRVCAAMESLDYSPSNAARQMRTGRSPAIGMLYSDPSSSYQSRLNHAMMQACSDAGRYLVVGLFDETQADWRAQMDEFLERTRVESMILVPPMCDSSVLQDTLATAGVRFVLLSPAQAAEGAASVSMNDRQAAREITQYLLSLGHTRIGHIAGHPAHIASLLRRQGYEEAMTEAGLAKPDASLLREGRFDFRAALDAARSLLTGDAPPTALFVANDDMAAAVYMAAGSLGLSIPGDLSVAGFDDVPIARTLWPSLTTVAQPLDAMAAACVRILTGGAPALRGAARSETYIARHDTVIRDSCAPPQRPSGKAASTRMLHQAIAG